MTSRFHNGVEWKPCGGFGVTFEAYGNGSGVIVQRFFDGACPWHWGSTRPFSPLHGTFDSFEAAVDDAEKHFRFSPQRGNP